MRRARLWQDGAALAGFVLLALAFTYPLALRLGTHVVQPAEDPQLNSWVLAWDVRSLLTAPAQLFHAPIFYPYPYALAYSEHLLSSAALLLPLQLSLNNPTAAYGALSILTFVLSGFGAYLLGRRVAGNFWAGLVAGVIFAFCPYKMSQMHHVQNLSAQWMPFAFLALDRAVAGGRRRDYALFALFTILQALASIYYALFLAVGVVLFAGALLALRWWGRWRTLLRRLAGLIGASLAAFVVVLPTFLPYQQVTALMGAGRSLSYVTQLSPDLVNYLAAPASNILYGRLTAPLRKAPEGSLWPGALALALAGLGVGVYIRGAGRRPFTGDGRTEARPLLLAFAILALGAGALSLGPTIQVAGRALLHGPYFLLWRFVPGFSGVRAPGRFAILAMLGVAVLAAAGAAWLLARARASRRAGLAAFFLLILGLEYAVYPWPTEPAPAAGPTPAVYAWLAAQAGDFAIVELPINFYPAFEDDVRYLGYAARHWKRLVNGYSGYFPAGYLALTELLQAFPDPLSLTVLRRLGVRYVLVHRDRLTPAQSAALDAGLRQSAARESLHMVGRFGATDVYALPAPAGAPALDLGTPAARPFLLGGWSAHDDRAAGRPFVWVERAEAALLLPVWERELRTLSVTARSAAGAARCWVALDGATVGEMTFGDGPAAPARLTLAEPPGLGMHVLSWRCAGGEAPTQPLRLGASDVRVPVDLAVAAGETYADIYIAGKRYSAPRDCPTCVGLAALRAGSAADVLWTTPDLATQEGRAAAHRALEGLPADSLLLLAAPVGALLPPELRPLLRDFGAEGLPRPADGAYGLLGARSAPAGAALEAVGTPDCWRYVGRPWPARRLAVERVELSP